MKYFRPDGSLAAEGTPEEIVAYNKAMTGRRRRRSSSPAGGYNRAVYSAYENAAIRKGVRDGKDWAQIARKLVKLNLSPHRRTPGAIRVQYYRTANS